MSAVRDEWALTLKDFERDENGVYWFDDGEYTRIDIGISVFGTRWVMNIFHKTTKITFTAPNRKRCIDAIPRFARAFE